MAKQRHSFASGYRQRRTFSHSFLSCQHTSENAQETLCYFLPSSLPHKKKKKRVTDRAVLIASQHPAVLPDGAQPVLCSDSAAGGQKSTSPLLPQRWSLQPRPVLLEPGANRSPGACPLLPGMTVFSQAMHLEENSLQ